MVCSKNGLDVMDGLEMIPDYHTTELTQVRSHSFINYVAHTGGRGMVD